MGMEVGGGQEGSEREKSSERGRELREKEKEETRGGYKARAHGWVGFWVGKHGRAKVHGWLCFSAGTFSLER